ncbi:MAG: tRNA lysidine(34) synthetase TilS [Elusimicrobia bacterium HGW-Elusimicrobia-1]|jgi:tRNA(Ile)-lysidine synthase|nr:MAG: tRNA lysidine(34) synthetase TilS [Elusimicrobia bacterium HGW-Elusimicrobia-1]
MMEKSFAEIVKKKRLIPRGSKILVAASGGPDSAALALLLHKYRALFGLASAELVYFDHGLRSRKEIAGDIAVVEKLSAATGFPSAIIKIKIPRAGASVENKARKERYRLLEKIARSGGYDIVMTAHTADDNAETLIMRLLRGTGLKGLGGIPPARHLARGIELIRPLVFFRKKELLDFLRRRRFGYSSDSTNRDERFLRNAVRKRVIPEMEKLNPAVVRHLSNLAEMLSGDSDFLEEAAAAAYGKVVSGGVLDLKKFFRYNVSVRSRVVGIWLGELNDFALTRTVDGFLSDSAARVLKTGGLSLKKEGGRVINETLLKSSRRH